MVVSPQEKDLKFPLCASNFQNKGQTLLMRSASFFHGRLHKNIPVFVFLFWCGFYSYKHPFFCHFIFLNDSEYIMFVFT